MYKHYPNNMSTSNVKKLTKQIICRSKGGPITQNFCKVLYVRRFHLGKPGPKIENLWTKYGTGCKCEKKRKMKKAEPLKMLIRGISEKIDGGRRGRIRVRV